MKLTDNIVKTKEGNYYKINFSINEILSLWKQDEKYYISELYRYNIVENKNDMNNYRWLNKERRTYFTKGMFVPTVLSIEEDDVVIKEDGTIKFRENSINVLNGFGNILGADNNTDEIEVFLYIVSSREYFLSHYIITELYPLITMSTVWKIYPYSMEQIPTEVVNPFNKTKKYMINWAYDMLDGGNFSNIPYNKYGLPLNKQEKDTILTNNQLVKLVNMVNDFEVGNSEYFEKGRFTKEDDAITEMASYKIKGLYNIFTVISNLSEEGKYTLNQIVTLLLSEQDEIKDYCKRQRSYTVDTIGDYMWKLFIDN